MQTYRDPQPFVFHRREKVYFLLVANLLFLFGVVIVSIAMQSRLDEIELFLFWPFATAAPFFLLCFAAEWFSIRDKQKSLVLPGRVRDDDLIVLPIGVGCTAWILGAVALAAASLILNPIFVAVTLFVLESLAIQQLWHQHFFLARHARLKKLQASRNKERYEQKKKQEKELQWLARERREEIKERTRKAAEEQMQSTRHKKRITAFEAKLDKWERTLRVHAYGVLGPNVSNWHKKRFDEWYAELFRRLRTRLDTFLLPSGTEPNYDELEKRVVAFAAKLIIDQDLLELFRPVVNDPDNYLSKEDFQAERKRMFDLDTDAYLLAINNLKKQYAAFLAIANDKQPAPTDRNQRQGHFQQLLDAQAIRHQAFAEIDESIQQQAAMMPQPPSQEIIDKTKQAEYAKWLTEHPEYDQPEPTVATV